jgi:hypothetical protein
MEIRLKKRYTYLATDRITCALGTYQREYLQLRRDGIINPRAEPNLRLIDARRLSAKRPDLPRLIK